MVAYSCALLSNSAPWLLWGAVAVSACSSDLPFGADLCDSDHYALPPPGSTDPCPSGAACCAAGLHCFGIVGVGSWYVCSHECTSEADCEAPLPHCGSTHVCRAWGDGAAHAGACSGNADCMTGNCVNAGI